MQSKATSISIQIDFCGRDVTALHPKLEIDGEIQ